MFLTKKRRCLLEDPIRAYLYRDNLQVTRWYNRIEKFSTINFLEKCHYSIPIEYHCEQRVFEAGRVPSSTFCLKRLKHDDLYSYRLSMKLLGVSIFWLVCKKQITIMYLWKQIESAPLVQSHIFWMWYISMSGLYCSCLLGFKFSVALADQQLLLPIHVSRGFLSRDLSVVLPFPLAFILATRSWLINCLTPHIFPLLLVLILVVGFILILFWHLIIFKPRQITTLPNTMCASPCRTKW
jgi:hypothetical protein